MVDGYTIIFPAGSINQEFLIFLREFDKKSVVKQNFQAAFGAEVATSS